MRCGRIPSGVLRDEDDGNVKQSMEELLEPIGRYTGCIVVVRVVCEHLRRRDNGDQTIGEDCCSHDRNPNHDRL